MFERDPREGRGIYIQLDGDNAWPELRRRSYWRASDISIAVIPNGTTAGRAAVAMRFDTTDKKIVVAQMTLRELYAAVKSVVAAHGEEWMKSTNETTERLKQDLIVAELARQVTALQQELGREPVLDMSAADAEFDRLMKGTK